MSAKTFGRSQSMLTILKASPLIGKKRHAEPMHREWSVLSRAKCIDLRVLRLRKILALGDGVQTQRRRVRQPHVEQF